MPAKDLGARYVCFKCTTKFYDMKKPDPLCPKCGADQRENPALKAPPEGGRRSRLSSVPKVVEPAVAADDSDSVLENEEDLDSFEDVEDAEIPAEEEDI